MCVNTHPSPHEVDWGITPHQPSDNHQHLALFEADPFRSLLSLLREETKAPWRMSVKSVAKSMRRLMTVRNQGRVRGAVCLKRRLLVGDPLNHFLYISEAIRNECDESENENEIHMNRPRLD